MAVALEQFIEDFARALVAVDARMPVVVNQRSGERFRPGIGPHSEAETIKLVMAALKEQVHQVYGDFGLSVKYPNFPRSRCDLCLGEGPHWDLALEFKLLRFLGDNGKINDNILMHILSPYPQHRSALTDCEKLLRSGFSCEKAIVIYGFDHEEYPMDPAIEAFEALAGSRQRIGSRVMARFGPLVHPVHYIGRIFGWKLIDTTV